MECKEFGQLPSAIHCYVLKVGHHCDGDMSNREARILLVQMIPRDSTWTLPNGLSGV